MKEMEVQEFNLVMIQSQKKRKQLEERERIKQIKNANAVQMEIIIQRDDQRKNEEVIKIDK